MAFAENLLNARKRKGLSQEKLAEMLHVSRQAVSKWENGRIHARHGQPHPPARGAGHFPGCAFVRGARRTRHRGQRARQRAGCPSATRQRRRAKRIWGAALLALGMLGVLVIWILSTMLPTAVPVQAAGSAPNSWEVWDEIVYEFGPFVRARRLQALLAALGACALAGGGLLIASARRNAPKG